VTRTLPELTSLRALACLTVFGGHAGILPRGGTMGVMLFFTLSGFLMAHLHKNERAWGKYFVLRIARIYPAYIVVLLLFHRAGILPHLLTLQGERHFWTIPVELHFYLLFPLISVLLPKDWRVRQSALWVILVVCAIVSIYFPLQSLLRCLPFFIAGMAGEAAFRISGEKRKTTIGFGICLVLLGVVYLASHTAHNPWEFSAWLPFVFVGLVFSSLNTTGFTKRLLTHPMLLFFGEISFSFYLLHRFALDAFPENTLFAFLITSVGACGMYLLVEQPARRWARGLADKVFYVRRRSVVA
jgi:peptidoglycan/LPS O-acetylase OafA/YrhL